MLAKFILHILGTHITIAQLPFWAVFEKYLRRF